MGFGEKVKETLSLTFEPIVDAIETPIKWGISWGVETMLDILGSRMAPVMQNLIKTMEDTGKVPPEMQPLLDEMKNPTGEIASLLQFSAARGGLGAVSGGFLTTITAALDQALKAIFQPSLLDVRSIIDTERRVPGSEAFCEQEWLWSGFNGDRRDLLREVTRPLLALEQLRVIYHRFPNQGEYIDSQLRSMGFTDTDIANIKLTWPILPGVQDLIRMAVREAFSPDIIEKYGTGADFPEEFAAEAEKQGLGREWALRYWQSHWNLPSIGQGFEMLHRGQLDDEGIDTLLRTQDVMPYWREKLKAIAYRPLTRVDVRRMHKLGTLDRDGVKKAYMDIGYNEYNAELMTEFTVQYNTATERDLTKTEILQLYRAGTMEIDEASELLGDLGYSVDTIDYLLQEQDADLAEAKRNLSMSQIKNLAFAGLIEKGEATGKLAELGYTAADIENLYALWELEAVPSVRLPARTDLENFWEDGIIDDDTWYGRMLQLGYEEEVVIWFYLRMSAAKG